MLKYVERVSEVTSRKEAKSFVRTMGWYSSGQRGETVNLLACAFEGSNPSQPTIRKARKIAQGVVVALRSAFNVHLGTPQAMLSSSYP